MMKIVVLALAFVVSAPMVWGLNLNPEEIPVAIEYDLSIVKREVASSPDIADVQNAEDDPKNFKAECGAGVTYMKDPADCGKYYQCANGIPYHLSCGAGLYFNLDLKVCDYPSNVFCAQERSDKRRIGRLSSSDEGANSTAQCPDGYFPVQCVASDPRRSSGSVIEGNSCLAFNGNKGLGQRAIATCVAADDNEYTVVNSGDFERQPSVSCPEEHRVINCLLQNPWSHIQFAFPTIDVSQNSCSADIVCLAGWGCSVQAMCRRV